MERLNLLSVALGLACLAGLNLYLTVFATGLAIHFHWIVLAPQYQSLSILGDPIVITISGVLFLLEFFADKIPWIDSIWDAVHRRCTSRHSSAGAFHPNARYRHCATRGHDLAGNSHGEGYNPASV